MERGERSSSLLLVGMLLFAPAVLAAGPSSGLSLALLIGGIVIAVFIAFLIYVLFSKSKYHPLTMQELIEKYKMISPDNDAYRLTLFVKDAHLYEHSFDEIKANLTALGWSADLVNRAFNEIRMDAYLIDAMEEGKTKQQMEVELLQAGWTAEQVKAAFERCLLI